jgi:hypothetical protein
MAKSPIMTKNMQREKRGGVASKAQTGRKEQTDVTVCQCGCGTKIPKYDKNGNLRRFVLGHNHHLRKISDEFTDLPISRERKRQLRALKKGLCCIAGCDEKLATKVHCLKHAVERREKSRRLRKVTRRWKNAKTYLLEQEIKEKSKGRK